MRLLLLLVLGLSSCTLAKSQTEVADSALLPFVAYWSEGDIFEFKVKKVKLEYHDGVLAKADSAVYNSKMKILEEADNYYEIQWDYQQLDLMGAKLPQEIVQSLNSFEYQPVVYRTDELGTFQEIVNWEELASSMQRVMEQVLFQLASRISDTEASQLRQTIDPILAAYSTKEGIEQLAFKEIPYIHFPFGAEYVIGDTLSYEESLPNLFGDQPLRGDVQVYFSDVDQKKRYSKIIHEMRLNEDDAKALLVVMWNQMAPDSDKDELEELMQTSTYQISDYNTYEHLYDPGVPLRIEVKREVLMKFGPQEVRAIKLTLIELKKDN